MFHLYWICWWQTENFIKLDKKKKYWRTQTKHRLSWLSSFALKISKSQDDVGYSLPRGLPTRWRSASASTRPTPGQTSLKLDFPPNYLPSDLLSTTIREDPSWRSDNVFCWLWSSLCWRVKLSPLSDLFVLPKLIIRLYKHLTLLEEIFTLLIHTDTSQRTVQMFAWEEFCTKLL